jgi:tetratricopeptide (TPR) repeat protein
VAWPEPADVPLPVAGVVEACLADAPADRPAAADVAAALSCWLSAERGEHTPKKRRAVRLAAAAAAAAVVLGSAALLGTGNRVTGGQPEVPTPPTLVEAPTDPFTRGLTLLRESKVSDALDEFNAAAKEQHHERTRDYQIYCLIRKGFASPNMEVRRANLNAAIELGSEAWESGADSPVMNNNVGYACIEIGNFAEALTYLNSAVEQSPDLAAARFNRACAHLKLMIKAPQPKKAGGPPRLPDLTAAEDIQLVLLSPNPPRSAEFYRYAALILAASSHLDPRLGDLAVRCMADAIGLGQPLSLVDDPYLSRILSNQGGFGELRNLTPPPGPPRADQFRVVEPNQP